MAEKHERYKEGKDFVWVDKGGYKTRRFLTKKEKEAPAEKPKASEAPKAKAQQKKPSSKPSTPTRTKVESSPRPKARPEKSTSEPTGDKKPANNKKVVRDTREIIDRTAPSRSTKGKVKKPTVTQAPYSDQAKRDRKRKKEPVAAKAYDKVYGRDKWKPK